MSYIWENYNPRNYFSIAQKEFSPYIEILDSNGTEYQHQYRNIEVNCLKRFSKIFEQTLGENIQVEKYADIINIFLHVLANLDLHSGLTYTEVKLNLIYDEIQREFYGKSIRKAVSELKKEHVFILLRYLLFYDDFENRNDLFYEVVANSLDIGECRYLIDEKKWLLHIKEKENEYTKKYVGIIAEFFLDYKSDYRICWEYAFGILERVNTMKIDCVQIV